MQWSDVADVTVENSSRFDFTAYFRSGSRRNVVLIAPVNRLGGPNRLMVPIRLIALDTPALEMLLRDLFCWRAAGMSLGGSIEESASHTGTYTDFQAADPTRQARPSALAPAPRAADPMPEAETRAATGDTFDPDEIMARYLRDRERVQAQGDAARQASFAQQSAVRDAMPAPARPGVFGRKGL